MIYLVLELTPKCAIPDSVQGLLLAGLWGTRWGAGTQLGLVACKVILFLSFLSGPSKKFYKYVF